MTIEVRSIVSGEIETLLRAMSGPFAFDLPDEEDKRAETVERFGRLFEPERARCAFEDGTMVGTLGAFTLAMTVPGGSVSCAGTTIVTVQPTHRRRGILREMMRAHLADASDREDPIAALWASDSAIYGRFGYGVASIEVDLDMPTSHPELHRLAPAPAPVRLVSADDARTVLPGVYDRFVDGRPGALRRSPDWWELRVLRDTPERRNGATAFRFAVAEGDQGPIGYALYRVKEDWSEAHASHQVRVGELVALEPSGWSGLWSFLLSIDLATRLRAHHRPVDDPLFDLLEAPRRTTSPVGDALWVRVVDVAGALSARRYGAAGRLVLEVSDPMGMVSGRWLLETDGGEATCVPTRDEPDITLDVEDLGACYLGRSRFRELARAGRLEGSVDALALADRLFGWSPPPWCPEVF